ncbi:MAG: type I methionyl aminopeptidase [Bosea sp. (in: a-proteobacteria)]
MSNTEAMIAPKRSNEIKRHGPQAFAAMRKAGQLVAKGLDMITDYVKPGVTTARLDRLMFEFAMDHGAYPATLNYRGYRYSICTSIGKVVCHGMPDDQPLREGKIINIDYTLIVDGWHGDTSRMYAVGKLDRKSERLCEVTYESLMRGIAAVRPGAYFNDIGKAIQAYAEYERCSVVRDFCGHGVGQLFHDAPNILHYDCKPDPKTKQKQLVIEPGMLFTIEPMINLGKPDVRVLADGWTAETCDKSLSAQFEHTVGVTDTGVEIFTLSPAGLDYPIGKQG